MKLLVVIGSSYSTGAIAALRWFLDCVGKRAGYDITLFHLMFEKRLSGISDKIAQVGYPPWVLNGSVLKNAMRHVLARPFLVLQMVGLRLQIKYPLLPLWLLKVFVAHRKKYDVALGFADGLVGECVALFNANRHFGWCHEDYGRKVFPARRRAGTIRRLSSLDGVFCASETARDAVVAMLGHGFSDRAFVFHNLFPIEKLKSQSKSAASDCSLRIITVARMETGKRLDFCIEIAVELKRRHVDFGWTIYGEGPLRETLLKLAEEKGVADCVTMPGADYAWREKVPVGSVFVHPSQGEGWGLVLEEAVAEGATIVCTDMPVFHEVSAWIGVAFRYANTIMEFADQIMAACGTPCSQPIAIDKIQCGYERDLANFYRIVEGTYA